MQASVDCWEIECNHRDEKSLIGMAQGQVWKPLAVVCLPQFQVAIYSLLLLASILAYGFQSTAAYLPLPLLRSKSIRPSVLDLLNLLRDQVFCSCNAGQPDAKYGRHRGLCPVDTNERNLR